MQVKGNQVVLAIILLVLGFLITFSYQVTKDHQVDKTSIKDWQTAYDLRETLINQEKRTRTLQTELFAKQKEVRAIEAALAVQEARFSDVVADVRQLRMFAGVIGVKGPGIEVTLEDASFVGENPNEYIVHDIHIQKLLNELRASGAEALSINGQRFLSDSYFACIGPVITVDGHEFSAPFVIQAMGDPDVLIAALNLPQGVKDQLVFDNIQVKIEKKTELIFAPTLQEVNKKFK